MTKIITHEILRTWSPCIDGFNRFKELFPNGADLLTAIDGLVADNHDSWGEWLFHKCKENRFCDDITDKGYRNTGDRNTGDWNTGGRNTGYRNTGGRNTGDWNTGDWNTGGRNTGGRNTGDWNTGDWNKASYQTGYFNTQNPSDVMVFNKPYNRTEWLNCTKPDFIFNVVPNIWISESEMTDQEKIDNPKFYVAEGYLKSIPMADAWAIAWETASDDDKKLLKSLPNFDAGIFKEISGIDVDVI